VRDYELVVLISPQVADDEVDGLVDRVKQFVTTRGGEIGKVNRWGRRKLAYYIQDFEEATYVQIDFTSGPEAIVEVESNLKLTEEIIRHLIVKAEDTAITR
jgi:small subunit ribosomal protein S6